MDNYTQCMWNANGELSCKRVEIKPVSPYKYVLFKDFNTPTENYDPDAYRKNISYYETSKYPNKELVRNGMNSK